MLFNLNNVDLTKDLLLSTTACNKQNCLNDIEKNSFKVFDYSSSLNKITI